MAVLRRHIVQMPQVRSTHSSFGDISAGRVYAADSAATYRVLLKQHQRRDFAVVSANFSDHTARHTLTASLGFLYLFCRNPES